MTVKILAFDGSGRKESINRNVLDHVIAQAKTHDAEVTQINLHDFNLPIYNGDLESEVGTPEAVTKLKELFKSHDAFLIATPEYNGSFSPLLKNALDWVSRPVQGEAYLNCFQGKTAGLITASAGKLGGMRGIYQLNTVLFGVGVTVLPNIVSVAFYNDAIDGQNQLKNDADKNSVATLAKRVVDVTKAIKNS